MVLWYLYYFYRSSDKKKNMAAQKAQAQKRLLRPNRRSDMEMSELEKKRQSVERKKEELVRQKRMMVDFI